MTASHTLPATLVDVPSDEYAITGYRAIRGREGDAFTATLTRYGAAVATVHDDGNGGETDVEFTDGREYEHGGRTYRRTVRLNDISTSPERDAFLAYAARFTGQWDADHDLDWSPEGVVATLVDEAALTAELNRRKHAALLLTGDDPRRGYQTLNTTDNHAAARHVAGTLDSAARIWFSGAWTPVTNL